MAKLTDFGMAVRVKLLEKGKTQEWLVVQVRERTGDFFDSSYLWRLLHGATPGETGRDGKPGKIEVICDILGIDRRVDET